MGNPTALHASPKLYMTLSYSSVCFTFYKNAAPTGDKYVMGTSFKHGSKPL